jgi:serine/threonine protein kinase
MKVELRILENQSETGRFKIGSGEYVIGRDTACDFVIASDDVSRRHARLTVDDGGVFIEDLGSANGTFVNRRRAFGRVRLESGTPAQLGRVLVEAHWEKIIETVATEQPGAPLDDKVALVRGEKYELGNFVAGGGMGVVHRARDRHVRRGVAMKLMRDDAVESPAKWLRFLEEAQVTGQLEHPNIVPVYDIGIDAQGRLFYTMRFVRGINLGVVLEDIRNGKADTIAQFPLGRLLTILQKACDAVSYAHSKGVIHRDLKPENIMIGDFGEVLVLDWGLAKKLANRTPLREAMESGDLIESVREANDDAGRTREGVVLGTPHFMSPEQANGWIDRIDERSDIFMLGGVLYNILTLQFPFPGKTTKEAVTKIREGKILPPASYNKSTALPHCPSGLIPESLSAVAMKALAFQPQDRYQTVRELQRDIEAYQGGFATSAERASFFKQVSLLIKRRKFEFSIAAMTFIALAVIGSVAITRVVQSERRARQSLAALRNAAPAYCTQAESLIDAQKFYQALDNVSIAIRLMPDRAESFVLKGNILESLLRLPEARDSYREALRLDPSSIQALDNFQLCEKLIADNEGRSELSPGSLYELQAAMLRQQRSAEALAMVRRLGKDTQALYDTWLSILADAGLVEKGRVSPRLLVNDQGQFCLNLNRVKTDNIAALKGMPVKELHLMGTNVRDLTPLQDAPLTLLNLAGTPVSDLEPLRGLPIKVLILADCHNVTDLSPLADCAQLETLILPPQPENIGALRNLPNLKRISPLTIAPPGKNELGRKEPRLEFRGKGLQRLDDLTIPAAAFWEKWSADKE